MNIRTIILLLTAAFSSLACAQDFNLPAKWIKIKVTIDAPDSLKQEMTSFLTRELRALNDVEIVETAHEYRIDVVALEVSTRGNVNTGYAVSALVTQTLKLGSLKFVYKVLCQGSDSKLYDKLIGAAETETAGIEFPVTHVLRIAPPEGLKKLCEGLIASIDSGTFENARKIMQKIKRSLEEAK